MISVSNLFKQSTNDEIIESSFKIFVSKRNDGEILTTLTRDDIVEDTIEIVKSATGSNNFNIGGVGMGTLKLTLTRDGVLKMQNAGAFAKKYCLHLVMWLKVDDVNQNTEDITINLDNTENQTGKCDLGYYYIGEIKNTDYFCDISAYDIMIALEKEVSNQFLKNLIEEEKSIASILNDIETYCSNSWYAVTFDISNSYILSGTFKIDEDTNFDTYRTVLGYITMLCGGFAKINSTNKISITRYNLTTSLEETDSNKLNSFNFDSSLSRIETITSSVAGFDYVKAITDEMPNTQDIQLLLKENPFLRGIEEEGAESLSVRSKDALDNVSNYYLGKTFFGGEFDIFSKFYFEIGDMITVNHVYVNSDGTVSTDNKTNVVITQIIIKINGSVKVTSNSTVAGTTISSTSKTHKRGGGAGGSTTGGVKMLEFEPDAGSDYGIVTESKVYITVSEDAGLLLTGVALLNSPSNPTSLVKGNTYYLRVSFCVNNNTFPNNLFYTLVPFTFSNLTDVYHGLSIPFNIKVPGVRVRHFKASLDYFAITLYYDLFDSNMNRINEQPIKPSFYYSIIADGLRKISAYHSTPEDFELDLLALELDGGLWNYKLDTQIATWQQLIDAGFDIRNYTTTRPNSNMAILDSFAEGDVTNNVLIIPEDLGYTILTNCYKSATIDTIIIHTNKILGTFRYQESDDNTKYVLKKIWVDNRCTLSSSSTRPFQDIINLNPYFRLYTNASATETTGFVGYTYWNIGTNKSCDAIRGLDIGVNLDYTLMGAGSAGTGLVFNEADLRAIPGLYDSANRLIVTFDRLKDLGIMNIENTSSNNDYIAQVRGGRIALELADLYNKATKLIISSTDISKLSDVAFSGDPTLGTVIGENLKVLVIQPGITTDFTLGRHCFTYCNLDHIYIPKESKCASVAYSPWFHTKEDLQVYTNASSSEGAEFLARIGVTESASTFIDINNFNFDIN